MTAAEWYIVTPPYTHASAGVVVLHRLCHKLREIGREAFVSTTGTNPMWNTPHKPAPAPNGIVVYPESIGGNPFGARHVVRYVLFYPGKIGSGTTEYDPAELVVYYGDRFRIGPGPVVIIAATDASLFYDTHEPKTRDVVFVCKGDPSAAPWPGGATRITQWWPPTREETAALLRSARRVYSYDSCSAILLESTLCGAEVYVPQDGRWARHETPSQPFEWDDLTETRRLVEIAEQWRAERIGQP
jgi:hypothetical protein